MISIIHMLVLERIHLQIIDSLFRNASLTRAAEEMNLTQSALTHRIKKLEDMLGVKLWEKDGRGLRLTEAGKLLRREAGRLEPQFRELESLLRAHGEGRLGRLRIGVECHPCHEILLEIIRRFLERWSSVDIDVTRNFRFSGYQALREHKVDVIISPDYLENPGFEYYIIRKFELLLATAPKHSLAEKEFVLPQDLRDETLYSYPISRDRLDIFVNFLLPAGIQPKNHEVIEDTKLILQLVSVGRGVSTFPDWILEDHSLNLPVQKIRLGPSGIHKKLFLVVRKDTHRPVFLNDFISLAQS